ncbi:MAG: ATP-binding protein, partial [Ghiorsea sp.]
NSSKSLQTLINDILDLTAAESGHLTLNHAHFDISACLKGALAPFLLAGKDKGLDFSFEMKDLPELVMGDEMRFRQVVLNLVGNAMKFTDQGKIEVVAQMKFNGSGDSLLHFSVKDTGYGIAPERLSEVFEPFVQFRNLGKKQQVGTGLGTSIIKRLITMMHGQVWVKSVLGEGSCFAFEIPLQSAVNSAPITERRSNTLQTLSPASSCAAPTTHSVSINHNKHATRVLLAEDDPISQKIAARRLGRAGLSVDIASDGDEAWQLLVKNAFHYDVLLTDLRMPGLDGISLAKKLRAHEKELQLAPLIIIGLSAHALKSVRDECAAIGMDAFLSKPVEAERVLHLVNKLSSSEQDKGE